MILKRTRTWEERLAPERTRWYSIERPCVIGNLEVEGTFEFEDPRTGGCFEIYLVICGGYENGEEPSQDSPGYPAGWEDVYAWFQRGDLWYRFDYDVYKGREKLEAALEAGIPEPDYESMYEDRMMARRGYSWDG